MNKQEEWLSFLDAMENFCRETIREADESLSCYEWLHAEDTETIQKMHIVKESFEVVLAYIKAGRKEN